RPRDRLHNYRRDGGSVVQRHDTLQFVRQFHAMLRNAPAEAVLLRQMRMRQMIDTGQKRAEHLAVGHDAADGDATEIDAMIAALAADQAEAGAFAPYAMIGDRHLKGGDRKSTRLNSS